MAGRRRKRVKRATPARRRKRLGRRKAAAGRAAGSDRLQRLLHREWDRLHTQVRPIFEQMNMIAPLIGKPVVTAAPGVCPVMPQARGAGRRVRRGTVADHVLTTMGSDPMRMTDILRSLPRSVNRNSAQNAITVLSGQGRLRKVKHGIYQKVG
jgi:hypothetical protein